MKKYATLILALILAGTISTAQARTTGYGCASLDVNHNQAITAADALIVLRASVGAGDESPSYDINHDNQITASDALAVLRAAVGLDSCEE